MNRRQFFKTLAATAAAAVVAPAVLAEWREEPHKWNGVAVMCPGFGRPKKYFKIIDGVWYDQESNPKTS